MRRPFLLFATTMLTPVAALAQQLPTTPPVNFTNSTSISPGTMIPNLLDSYANLMLNDPSVMVQNYQTVVTMTQNRTTAQTLAAIHDDRTAQPYSVMNGLGVLTNLFLTGAGASASGIAPTSLTPTTYATATLQNYAANINYLSNASAGSATFSNGTATPLAGAVNFINNIVRANSSTEPPKRTFERYMGTSTAINPLDPRFANYSVLTGGLTPADTANLVVPGYFSDFTVPAPFATTAQWVQGFTVTAAMIAANNGQPLTAPNLGTYDASGNFTPDLFTVGEYVPGIGTAPRPYRLTTAVNVPTQLYQIINNTNPYADGAFPSGHTNSAYLQALGTAFLVPQQYQELLTRASDLGNDRILAGMHSPLDVIGGRIEATAIAATNIYGALYDANGNRLDWTNPNNATAYSVYQAVSQTQNYLAQACGTATVAACLQQAQASGATANDPYGNASQNQANYLARLTYGFSPIGPTNVAEVVPVQAPVLLLTRFPYLTDQQRSDVLQSTALPSGYPLLSGNTWDGWGRLNLYAAANGYGAFASTVTVTMDASQGGYSALDTWSNDISGTGGLVKGGTGTLALTGTDTYTGDTVVAGGMLVVSGSIASSATTVGNGGTLSGGGTVGTLTVQSGGTVAPGLAGGALTVNGALSLQSGSTFSVLTSATGADRLVVSGAATIANGATLRVAPASFAANPYTAILGQDLTLIQAARGVSGQFGATTLPTTLLSAGTRFSLVYGGNAVDLYVTPNFANLASSGQAVSANEARAGQVINTLGSGSAGGDLGTVLGALYALPSAARTVASLDQIDGVSHAALVAADEARAMGLSTFIGHRLSALRDGTADLAPEGNLALSGSGHSLAAQASGGSDDAAPPISGRWTVWTEGLGQFTRISNSANTLGLHARTGGGLLGVDGAASPGLIVGLAGGVSETNTSVGDITSYSGTAYGTVDLGPVFVAGNLGYSFDQFSSRRTIAFGTIDRTATGKADGNDIGAGLAVGTRVAAGSVTVEPSGGLQWLHMNRDGFSETGAGALDLHVDQLDHSPLQANLQVRATTEWTADEMTVAPEFRLGMLHDFASRALTSTATLDGATLSAISPKTGRNAAAIGIGLFVKNVSGMALYVDYDGAFRTRENDQSITAGLRLSL